MKNAYEVRGDVTAILVKRKGKILETIISTISLERVLEFKNTWYADYSHNTGSYYVRGKVPTGGGKVVSMGIHRWIMGAPDVMVVDHVNHDTLDNTLNNLRLATHSENQQNRRAECSYSRSGSRGVSWSERNKKWEVYMKVKGKKKYFGTFQSLEDAIKCSVETRKKIMPYATC